MHCVLEQTSVLEEDDQPSEHEREDDKSDEQRHSERITEVDGPATTHSLRDTHAVILRITQSEEAHVLVHVAAAASPQRLLIGLHQSLGLHVLLDGEGEPDDNGC